LDLRQGTLISPAGSGQDMLAYSFGAGGHIDRGAPFTGNQSNI
jgi:hypothetical protein